MWDPGERGPVWGMELTSASAARLLSSASPFTGAGDQFLGQAWPGAYRHQQRHSLKPLLRGLASHPSPPFFFLVSRGCSPAQLAPFLKWPRGRFPGAPQRSEYRDLGGGGRDSPPCLFHSYCLYQNFKQYAPAVPHAYYSPSRGPHPVLVAPAAPLIL